MSSISPLVLAQQYVIRYGMTAYLTWGNIGLIFNMIIFSQRTFRQKPMPVYILATSICSFIGLNIAVIPIIYELDHTNYLATSLIYCRVQFYVRHAFNQMMRTFVVILCADRYASCSNQAYIRAFSRYQIAIYIIPSVIIVWLIISIFPTMLFSIINGVCDTQNGLPTAIYSIYIIIVLCVLPLIGMITFEFLIIINLKKMRIRTQPTIILNNLSLNVLRKRDRDMIKMLLVELSLYIFTSVPITLMIIYKWLTNSVIKNSERQQIETFIIFFIGVFLLYINNTLSFWIYILTAKSFRIEFKNIIINWYRFITVKLNRIN